MSVAALSKHPRPLGQFAVAALPNTPAPRRARPAVDTFERARATFTTPDYRAVSVGKSRLDAPELQYAVQMGDTLEGIAERLGTDTETLTQLNPWGARSLQTGGKLVLPSTFHLVRRGETYWGIAQRTGIPYETLMRLNQAPRDGRLEIGQEIRVPAALLSAEQVSLREQLKAIVAAGAAAQERISFGQGSTDPMNIGNELGYTSPNHGYTGYQFSDTYDSVKYRVGERESPESEPVVPTRLTDPVGDTKRAVASSILNRLTWLRFDQLSRAYPDSEILFPVDAVRLDNGRIQLKSYDLENLETAIVYDPAADTVTATFPDGMHWATDARRLDDAVTQLGKLLGVKMPANS